ncbi:hypothetical protein AAZV13_20G066200 [Glycine max]
MQGAVRKLTRIISHRQVVGFRSYCTDKVVVDIGQPTSASHPQLLKDGDLTPGISTEEYILRRKKLLDLLPEKSLAIIAAAPVKMMTDVVPYTFRQDADYLYITGCQQPGGVAVLGHDCGLCMFMPEAKPNDVIWQGQIAGVDAALDAFKADKAYPMKKLQEILPDMIRGSSKLFHNVETATPAYMELEAFKTLAYCNNVRDLTVYTHQLRWIKSPAELKLMKESASIACQALLLTMLHSKTYPFEGMLAAKVEYECKIRGAQRMGFNPVVGGGPNGSVILETNKHCVELCKPGASIRHIHNHSVEMLQKGLKELGILRDVGSSSYHKLNPTSIGHYLGMDIHDCSMVSNDCPLKPGVVITIEPGVYIPSSFNVPERYRGIGIRIEDEVLITETGYEVLTASIPKEVKHIESLLNNFCHGMGAMDSQNN